MASSPCVRHPQSSDGAAVVRRAGWVGFMAAVALSWVMRHELAHAFKAFGL